MPCRGLIVHQSPPRVVFEFRPDFKVVDMSIRVHGSPPHRLSKWALIEPRWPLGFSTSGSQENPSKFTGSSKTAGRILWRRGEHSAESRHGLHLATTRIV